MDVLPYETEVWKPVPDTREWLPNIKEVDCENRERNGWREEMNKFQEALENLRLLDCVDEENFEIKFEILPTLQELVDKFELIKAISKQKHDYYREEWLRYGEYEDKGRCSVFSQILNLIGDDEDE